MNFHRETMTEQDAMQAYRDMIDAVHVPVRIGELEWDPSRVLETMDPIAFRCGFSDYCDAVGIDTDELD